MGPRRGSLGVLSYRAERDNEAMVTKIRSPHVFLGSHALRPVAP